MDSATGHLYRMQPGVQQMRAIGCFEQATAFPLPATATFAQNTLNYLPTIFFNIRSRGTVQTARPLGMPACSTVHSYSLESIGIPLINHGGPVIGSLASAAWPGANWGVLIPFSLSRRQSFSKVFVFNGAVASGNIDLGIYDFNFQRLASTGSTPMSGTSVLQALGLSFIIGPGRYYMALAVDNSAAQFMRGTVSDDFGYTAAETNWCNPVFPLPSACTVTQFPNYTPLIGIAKGPVI
jgi:hypothetical protein